MTAHPHRIGRKEALTPARKSARLQEKQRLYQQPGIQEQILQLPSPTSISPDEEVYSTSLNATTDLSRRIRRIYHPHLDLSI